MTTGPYHGAVGQGGGRRARISFKVLQCGMGPLPQRGDRFFHSTLVPKDGEGGQLQVSTAYMVRFLVVTFFLGTAPVK